LGHFPFQGVQSENYKDISFSFKSFRFVFSFLIKLIAIIEFVTETVRRKIKHNNFNLESYTTFVLNGFGIPMGIYLIWLSYNWRKHMEFWCENEKVFSRKVYLGEKYFKKFKKRITWLFVIIVVYRLCK
jgi:pilus assembly protein TadC